MKILAYLIIFVLMCALIAFDWKNASVTVSYFMFNDTLKYSLLPLVVTVAFMGGLTAGIMYVVIALRDAKKLNLAQNKRVEKFSVDKDSADLKIQTLEAKIKTLETALEKSLKKS